MIKNLKSVQLKKLFTMNLLITFLLIVGLIYFSMWTRLGTLNAKTVLDYDPFWFYRYAKNILDNNLKSPKWDLLSFFPPGRPVIANQGWPYTMVLFFKILSLFKDISFMEVAKLSPVIMVGLSVIPAYLLGKLLTNKWGGLAAGLFATTTPTFIAVSMAGYCDTDVVVIFYSFLSVFSIILAMKKRTIPYYILAVLSNLLFIYNWWFGWYVLFFFILFVPILFSFRVLENVLEKGFKLNLKKIFLDLRELLISLLIIVVALNIIAIPLKLGTIYNFIYAALLFRSGEAAIVNVSVAELQPINVLTGGGYNIVAGRVGSTPMLFMLIGLPVVVMYKLYKKKQIGFDEIFLFLWAAITFYLILRGVRFSLLFSCAVAASAGYVIGELVDFFKDKNIFLRSSLIGVILFSIMMFISNTILFANASGGMEVSQNWLDMLDWLKENADPKAIIATWWDPGHIIAGYTGLRVHADGAHCSAFECIPYPHNTRIQNMGKIMSTDDEEEAVEILKKYMSLTPEQCQEVKKKYDGIVPEEACEPASEMYFISSSDLIGKFTWMNYFGGYRAPIHSQSDFISNPGVCCASTPETETGQLPCGEFADQGRGVWIWCPWIFSSPQVQQDQEGNNVYVYDYAGFKMAIIQKSDQLIPVYNNRYIINYMTFFSENGTLQMIDLSGLDTSLEKIDGLIWVDPGFGSLIYFAPAIKDSVFVRTFFYNGEGLEHFKLVYSNSEIRLYKVVF